MRLRRVWPAFFILLAVAGLRGVTAATQLGLQPYIAGLAAPVHAISTGTAGDKRLFIVEQDGLIRLVKNGALQTSPFLDLTDRVATARQYGVFGLAFHPDFAANRQFFVHYIHTPDGGTTYASRISRFTVPQATPDAADRSTEEVLLTIPFEGPGHWAGDIAFGPDGYLYIPFGDGDSPNNEGVMRAQNLNSLSGKLLRIDVDFDPVKPAADCKGAGSGQYNLPADNPYRTAPAEACGEIWASGLRNPWRLSFDSVTGDLFIADVGEDRYNEINHEPAGSAGGRNYGWPCFEAHAPFVAPGTDACQAPPAYAFPDFVTENVDGGDCSVTGGYVYRGAAMPSLAGAYLFGDYCSGAVSIARQAGGSWSVERVPGVATFDTVSFGRRSDGELLIVNRTAGTVSLLAGPGNPSLRVAVSTAGSATTTGSPGLPYSAADVLLHDGSAWSKDLNGSALGITRNVRGYARLNSGAHLLSLSGSQTFGSPAAFTASARDVIAYISGAPAPFTLYLDGEDIGLTTSGEAIDALAIDPAGRLVISTVGGAVVPCEKGASGCPATGVLAAQDEDLLVFNPAPGHTGAASAGTWALYFNGTGVRGLGIEDVGGASIGDDGTLYLSVYDAYAVGGQKGNGRTIFTVRSLPEGFEVRNVWRAGDVGLPSALDAIEIVP